MATLPPAMSAGLQAMDPELRRKIEEHAYSLWEADGRPEGRALEYWLRAEQAVSEQPVSEQETPRRKGATRPKVRESRDTRLTQ
jgi:hypothetical protein